MKNLPHLNIHYIQNECYEDLGNIKRWGLSNSVNFSSTRTYLNEQIPVNINFDALIILGGNFDLCQKKRPAWVSNTIQLIKKSIDSGKMILGICLGSQLIAEALGATVRKNHTKETGWGKVNFYPNICGTNHLLSCFDKEIDTLHWHENTFDIPNGAQLFCSSHLCKNQGFIFKDNIIGIQFHPEWTADIVKCVLDDEQIHNIEIRESILNHNFSKIEKKFFNFLDNIRVC